MQLSIAALMLAACGPKPYNLTADEQSTAELGARDFADNLNAEFIGCSGQDSDGDDYVTCTVSRGSQMQEIVCSYADNARGCKIK
jgi:hypothetical protein